MTHAAPPKTRRTPSQPAVDPRFDWRRIAYNMLASRAMDDLEETTNRNRTSVPREHLILYQFSSRGHDLAQTILGTLLDHPHDAAGAYYRCRPLLVTMGLSLEDALGSPLGASLLVYQKRRRNGSQLALFIRGTGFQQRRQASLQPLNLDRAAAKLGILHHP